MNKTYLDDNVYIIPNFLSEEELLALDAIIYDDEPWELSEVSKTSHTSNLKDTVWKTNIKMIKDKSLLKVINDKIKLLYPDLLITEVRALQRLFPGQILEAHFDKSRYSPYVERGFICYINDNYDGGQLYYPYKGYEYKPVRGSFASHPATEEYTHGVKPSSDNIRYILTSFGIAKKI
jgi:hypothetical protein